MLSGTLPVNPETSDYLDATLGLRKYYDRPITLVDALLARLTRRLEAPVWAFDLRYRLTYLPADEPAAAPRP